MKQAVKLISNKSKAVYMLLTLLFLQVMVWAQDAPTGTTETTKVNITSNTGNWFANNWLWIVGIVVFLILLFSMMGGGSSYRRKRTVVREDPLTGTRTRTTTTDDDVV